MANRTQNTRTGTTLKKTATGSVQANSLYGQNKSNTGAGSVNGNGKQSSTTRQVFSSAAKTKKGSAGTKHSLHKMFEDGLKDMYSAEKQLLEALPKLARAAESEELQDAFNTHLEQTRRHVERLDKVFSRLGISSEGENCAAMEGLIEEADKVISEYEENAVRDSALIICAQKVEHYEIAGYGSLCELADVLGHHKIHDILGKTLDEEEETDELLTDLAMDINDEALELSGGEEEEE